DLGLATWSQDLVGPPGGRAGAPVGGVALCHHDPGSLSARFVQERLRRATALPPVAHYPRGGWGGVIDRMAARDPHDG
ncbi:FAD-dependent oxidoreductase, partial [Streptomyces lavendulocolor]